MTQLPKISLQTASFTPAAFTPLVYTPEKRDMSILQRSLATLDERKENTDKQRAAIRGAIGKITLNAAEDEWKNNYVNNIMSKIDTAAQYGDYSAALETATDLAGKASSDPALISRIRYNESRNKWLENLEQRRARKEINGDTYARAVAQNPYAYKDTYDASGNVVGGLDWDAAFTPVNDLDLSQVMGEIKALVTASGTSRSSSGGTSQIYLDSKGNQTKDVKQARGVFANVSGGSSSYSKTGVTAEEWAAAYDAWMALHPEATAQFEQKRQNAIWNYNQQIIKAKDETISESERAEAKAYADVLYKEITDKDGAILSPSNYAKSIANPMFKVMQFSKVSTSSGGGSMLLNESYLKNKVIADTYNISVAEAEVYSIGSPMGEAVLKNAATNKQSVDNAGKSATGILVDSYNSSTYEWKPIAFGTKK